MQIRSAPEESDTPSIDHFHLSVCSSEESSKKCTLGSVHSNLRLTLTRGRLPFDGQEVRALSAE